VDWTAQQIVACCAWDQAPPRFLIHDRDSRYGANFDRRVQGLGIRQVRTPFRAPRANAVAERWVRSARSECLDHLIVFSEANLRRVLSAYVTYYNRWRPHRSLGQAAPCGEARALPRQACRKIAGTCAWRVTPHLPRCCMTSFCAPQRSIKRLDVSRRVPIRCGHQDRWPTQVGNERVRAFVLTPRDGISPCDSSAARCRRNVPLSEPWDQASARPA
jgi:Integrase core domain